MAAISGLTGLVAHGAGYVALVNGWAADLDAQMQDVTGFAAATLDQHQRLMVPVAEEDDTLKGGTGVYSCPLSVPAAAIVTTGAPYNVNIEQWSFFSQCVPHETTPLGAAWRTYEAGVISSGASVRSWIDDTQAQIIPGEALLANLVLTANAADSVTFPVATFPGIVAGVSPAVEIDGSARLVDCMIAASGPPTPAGAFILAGAAAALTLTSDAGRTYVGDALVTAVNIIVNRRFGLGSVECGFIFDGQVTPA